jgi:ribonuclease-3
LLEDVLEAVVGALSVDGGWDRARDFVRRCFTKRAEELDPAILALVDAKTTLQEAAQKRGIDLPEYRQLRSTGPDHEPEFVFEVIWNGHRVASGSGRSKRAAQVEAARAALRALDLV